jgi:hypothetical protein
MMLQNKKPVIDLKSSLFSVNVSETLTYRTNIYECSSNSIFSNLRLCTKASIQSLRQTLPRQSSNQIILMLRSIFDDGFCSTNLQGKPAGHRNMFAGIREKIVPLLRITYLNQEQKRTFMFLTNNFELNALTVCQLYKLRWQIELFFKWIKQHLRNKTDKKDIKDEFKI